MTTKKTNTKTTKKTTVKKNEQTEKVEETKNVQEMSVDELADMFINNDTENIERLKEENQPVEETSTEETEAPESEIASAFNEIMEEVQAEQPKEELKPVEEKKPETPKPVEQPKPVHQTKGIQPIQPQINTNRSVYGYDHFGMIYEY